MNKALAHGIFAASLLAGIQSANAATYKTCSVAGGCITGSSNISVSSTYTQTKYPLVFAHGMAGFSKVGPVDYWYGIPKDLVSGGSNVYVTQVASFQSSEVRGEQLLTQVKTILALSGSAKVNLIGHSHGNQSVRYVAAAIPANVATVTGVGGPQTGSPVADVIKGVTTIPGLGPLTGAVLSGAINGFFLVIDAISGQGYRQDALAGMASLTTAGAGAFNVKYPQALPPASNKCAEGAYTVNGVRYYSWSGTGHLTNFLDISDIPLAATGLVFPEANDGLVGKCASHLGQVIRDNYGMNHLDEVNQLFGLTSIFETSPVTLFRNQANRLKTAGL